LQIIGGKLTVCELSLLNCRFTGSVGRTLVSTNRYFFRKTML
jgi:hypothetical protein